jgi:signal transduction histidine kinase
VKDTHELEMRVGEPGRSSDMRSGTLPNVSAFGRVFGVLLRWRSPAGQATAWGVALVAPPVIAGATESFRASLGLTGFLFCALLVVVLVALVGGRRPAFAAVAVGFLAAGYVFTAPYNAFRFYIRPEDAPLAVFIVVGAAVAVLIDQLARLVEEQTSLRRVDSAVHRVATLVARAASAEEVFAAATEEVGGLLAVDLAGMGRFEADGTVTVLAGWRSDGERLPVGSRAAVEDGNLSALVAATGRPARIDNPSNASRSAGALLRDAGIRSAVAVPITVQARLWGIMIAGSTAENPLPADTEAQLADFTELLATAVANAESNAWLAMLAEEQAALRRIATLVAAGAPPEEVFLAVTDEIGRLVVGDLSHMLRYESDRTFTVVASTGARAQFPVGSRWPLGGKNVLSTLIFETARPGRINSYADSTGAAAEDARAEGVCSSVGAPIIVEGRLWGLVGVSSIREKPLPADTEARLASFTELVATAIANAQSRAALRPVERMRSQAAQITERELSARLPVSDDTGEVTALGRTLNSMLDRVEEAVARERRVVSDASHELRTPLTTLRAEVDLALMGDRDKAELRAALESASEEARRMSRLADDLLVLARADQGRLPLHPRPLTARELLEDAAGRAHAGAEVRRRSIVIADPDDGCAVRADPDRAAQALDNLITNALLYGDGTITLSAQSNHQYVEVHVADEGDGFPAELLPRAFERFGRGQRARSNEPGSGLGLALVEAVAVAHGGRAAVRNCPDGGADVSITLPCA